MSVPPGPQRTPEELLHAFLEAHPDPSPAEVEALCAEHPGHAAALRGLFKAHRAVAAALPSTLDEAALHRASRPSSVQVASGFRVEAGMTLGDFTLVRILGRGGMGEVWEAEQLSLSRPVALKLLLPERVDSKGLDFFAREARAGGRLSHPGIVAIHGTGEDEGLHWIAMELVEEACDLRRALDGMREEDELPDDYYEQSALFLAETADALEVAHAAGVIHRDLKPANILVTPDDHPKVSDFGLAKLTDEHSISLAGDLVGTYFYMSPEQVAAKRMGLDHRTDVFSLGVVLYEMLTLVRAFEGDTTEQVAHKILVVDPPPPNELRSKVPRDLAVICGKAMEKDPERRYGSMAELAADLRRHLADEPILARPPGTVERAVKWARRNPTKSAVAGVAAGALVVISLLLAQNLEKSRDLEGSNAALQEEKDRAVAAEADARRRSYVSMLRAADAGLAHGPGAAPEALEHLELCPTKLKNSWEWRHLNLLADQSLRTRAQLPEGATALARPERGATLAVGTESGDVHVLTAEPGANLADLSMGNGPVHDLTFDTTGRFLAAGNDEGSIRVWNTLDWTTAAEFTRPGIAVLAMAFSPDGSEITCGYLDGQVHVRSTGASGGGYLLGAATSGAAQIAYHPDGRLVAVGASNGDIGLWDLERRGAHTICRGHLDRITGLSFEATTDEIVSCSVDGSVRTWSIYDQRPKSVHDLGHVIPVCMSPLGTSNKLLLGASDGSITILELESGAASVLTGHRDSVTGVSPHLDGSGFISASPDGTIREWSAHGRREFTTSSSHRDTPYHGALDPGGRWLASGARDGAILVWELSSGRRMHTLTSSGAAVSCLASSPDGDLLLAGRIDGSLELWDPTSGERVRRWSAHERAVTGACFCERGEVLVSSSHDGRVRLWSRESGELVKDLATGAPIEVLTADPGGTLIAAGGLDGTITTYRQDSRELQLLRGHEGAVTALSLCGYAEAPRLFSGGADGEVYEWELSSGQVIWKAPDVHSGPVSLEHADDATLLVSSSVEGGAAFFRLGESAEETRVHLPQRAGEGRTATFSSTIMEGNPMRVATTSLDGAIRLWIPDGQYLHTLRGPDVALVSLLFNRQTETLIAFGVDGRITTWHGDPDTARRWWETADEAAALSPLVDGLLEEHVELQAALQALGDVEHLSPEDREDATNMLRARGEVSAEELNDQSWVTALSPGRSREDHEDALRWSRRACSLRPENTNFRSTQALVQYRLGNYEEATALLAQRNAEECVIAALVSGARGESAEAASLYRQAISKMQPGESSDLQALMAELEERLRE